MKYELKTEWEDVEKTSKKIIRAFTNWARENLVITYGKDRDMEMTFGLPYTSSSDYAALWACQGKGEYKLDRDWKFEALAVTTDGKYVAVFENEDVTLERKMLVIGKE